MELMLQCGWGMMDLCRSLVRRWGGGTVILSPRDLRAEQMTALARDVGAIGGTTLLDPQLYVPDCNHARLTAHPFWPRTPEYWRDPGELSRVIDQLVRANVACGTSGIICPSPFTSAVSDDALQPVSAAIAEFDSQGVDLSRVLATVALSSDALRNEDRAELLGDAIDEWNVGGIYLVAEHPNGEYLVGDPMWLARVLDIVAGARLAGKTVVIGYCSHQMLITASAGASAISSGTWLNVRKFSPTRFDEPDEDEISRRATWYYAPHLLSEFKVPFLDIAWRLGQLPALQTPPDIDGTFAAALFSGAQPTTVGFGERDAFQHYLQCLKQQVDATRASSFADTIMRHQEALGAAESRLNVLRRHNLVNQERSFLQVADASGAALTLLQATRGPILQREWATL